VKQGTLAIGVIEMAIGLVSMYWDNGTTEVKIKKAQCTINVRGCQLLSNKLHARRLLHKFCILI